MAKQGINTGSAPNDGLGDSLLSGAIKINSNFSEIYTTFGNGNTLSPVTGYANTSGIATYATIAGYSTSSGVSTTSNYATSSGIATYATIAGIATASTTDFAVGANLYVTGNISFGGTSVVLNAAQLQVKDRDIVVGYTTDGSNNDVSNDTTANHGGISVASTVGTPILNIPLQSGINSNPSTYKQWMWVKSGNYSGLGTDVWLSNYGVSIGNTSTVQNLSRLTVGAGFTVYDTYLDAQDIRARNINASGVSTFAGITTVSGDTLFTKQLSVSGVSTFSNTINAYNGIYINNSNIPIDINGAQIYENFTNLFLKPSAGVVIKGGGGSTNLGAFNYASSVDLYYDNSKKFETTGYGATVYGTLQSQGLQVSGIVTATSFRGDGSQLTGISASGGSTSSIDLLEVMLFA